jgi:hypothetical protein
MAGGLEALGLQEREEEIDAERDGDGEAKEQLEHDAPLRCA